MIRNTFLIFNDCGTSLVEIREFLGAGSLAYASIDNLVKSISLPGWSLCLGCLTGEYPVDIHGLEKWGF